MRLGHLELGRASTTEFYKSHLAQKEELYKQAISGFIGYEATLETAHLWSNRVDLYISDACKTEVLLVDGIRVLSMEIRGVNIHYEFNY